MAQAAAYISSRIFGEKGDTFMTPVEVAVVRAAISLTLNVVVTKLAPSVIEWYSSIGGVPEDLEELLEDVQAIRVLLEETGYEAKMNDPFFDWLKRLRDVAYDVDDVVNEFQLQSEKHDAGANGGILSKYMWTKTKLFNVQCKAANKIKIIKKRFAGIVKKRSDFSAIANSLQVGHPVWYMNKATFETPTFPIVDVASVLGRDQDKKNIITELLKSNGQQEKEIISVVGLGGSGKTTLAQLIFNDTETLNNHFELKIWVHVSQEFNVVKLIEKLFEAVTKERFDKYPLQHIIEEISNRLNGKKFLLVLDDVWRGDKIQWEQFMVHLKSGAPESKILVTTRSRRVAQAMGSIPIFDLSFLSLDDSWQLFHRSFGAGVQRLSCDFLVVGKEIVKKCGGMPLAIKSLAGVLSGIEPRIQDWQAIRDNNLLDVQGEEHRVAASLRLSYSHLQYDLKQCFTICSVFPKGHKIDKQQLIDLWIAHDMISTDCIGNKHFTSLVQISFLQNVEEEDGRVTCRMHDLVHDLAQHILGDEISLAMPKEEESSTMSYRYFSLREQPEDIVPKNVFEKARAVYITKCYDYIFGMALKKAKHLRSVTVESPYVTALPNVVFQINNLKYLSMSRLNCEELPDAISDVWSLQALHITDSQYLLRLPESISKLKKLRTLNLSGCRYLNRLPYSVGDCHMISNIDLCHCEGLRVLPNSIGRIKELRVLNLEGCVELRSLLVLKGQVDRVQNINIFVLGRGKKSARISEHANIGNGNLPRGHTYVMEPDDVHGTWLKQKTNLQSLSLYAEVNNEFVEATLHDLEPPPGIKMLEIHGYTGTQYAWWMQNQVDGGVQGPTPFPLLRVMKLYDFPNLKNIHGLVELPCLEELELKWMPSLESVSGGPFPSLVKLEMNDLPCLGEVRMVAYGTMPDGEEGGGCCNLTPQLGQVRVGNCLTKLEIRCCPKLEMKPHLPLSLQYLQLWGSEQLLQSPGQCLGSSSSSPSFSNLKKLEVGLGSGHGWELLQHLTALESLEINFFSWVETELPESLWSLTSLRSMKVHNWSNIRMLPESLGELRSLQELTIFGCHSLSSLPQSMGQLTSLQLLTISDLPELTCLPQPICRLTTSLQELHIFTCPGIKSLPEGMKDLVSLEKLSIDVCPGLTSLPQGMEGLVSLEELWVNSCPKIKSLPEGIKGLTTLKKLRILDCPDLVRRCMRETGEDWQLISHIPDVFIHGLDV